MPASKENPVTVEIRHDDELGLVRYGFVQDGVFHTVASERKGDYHERVAAAKAEDE
jgi:hypothetical protein